MSRKSDIAEALAVFTPAALMDRTITAHTRALATTLNPDLEAAMNPALTPRKPKNNENWQAYVYGGSKNPKL